MSLILDNKSVSVHNQAFVLRLQWSPGFCIWRSSRCNCWRRLTTDTTWPSSSFPRPSGRWTGCSTSVRTLLVPADLWGNGVRSLAKRGFGRWCYRRQTTFPEVVWHPGVGQILYTTSLIITLLIYTTTVLNKYQKGGLDRNHGDNPLYRNSKKNHLVFQWHLK